MTLNLYDDSVNNCLKSKSNSNLKKTFKYLSHICFRRVVDTWEGIFEVFFLQTITLWNIIYNEIPEKALGYLFILSKNMKS